MYQELASTDFLQVAYRSDSGLLIGRWLCPVTEPELHEGYEAMRLAARQHRCQHWLIDARRRTDRRLNGPEWVVTRFLPQVQQEMNQPLCVAFLVLPDHLREVEADANRSAKSTDLSTPFQYARFLDEGAANAWLDGFQRRE